MGDHRIILASVNEHCYDSVNGEVTHMLIEYRVKNFMSYRDEIIFSMVADKNRELSDTNTFKQGNLTLLKTAAIFGANASGKTNFIASLHYLVRLMRANVDSKALLRELPTFKLDTTSENLPISYELSFVMDGQRHRYGLELDPNGIRSEWLYFAPHRQEACYFERNYDEITTTGVYFGDKKALDFIKPDPFRPFLFTLGQESVKQFTWAKKILTYLRMDLRAGQFPDLWYNSQIQKELVESKQQEVISKDQLVAFLKAADVGVADISVAKEKRSAEEQNMLRQLASVFNENDQDMEEDKYETFMHHFKYDDNEQVVGQERFNLNMESQGTIKFFTLQYPILNVLKKGGVLFIDELEDSLHPLLCEKIIQLFHNEQTNPKHAQLIFTTHNTLLMNPSLLRRDQIYFTEKNKYGASKLYSLYDIDLDIRSNFNYLNNYLSGRFGAIPYLGSFELGELQREGADG